MSEKWVRIKTWTPTKLFRRLVRVCVPCIQFHLDLSWMFLSYSSTHASEREKLFSFFIVAVSLLLRVSVPLWRRSGRSLFLRVWFGGVGGSLCCGSCPLRLQLFSGRRTQDAAGRSTLADEFGFVNEPERSRYSPDHLVQNRVLWPRREMITWVCADFTLSHHRLYYYYYYCITAHLFHWLADWPTSLHDFTGYTYRHLSLCFKAYYCVHFLAYYFKDRQLIIIKLFREPVGAWNCNGHNDQNLVI